MFVAFDLPIVGSVAFAITVVLVWVAWLILWLIFSPLSPFREPVPESPLAAGPEAEPPAEAATLGAAAARRLLSSLIKGDPERMLSHLTESAAARLVQLGAQLQPAAAAAIPATWFSQDALRVVSRLRAADDRVFAPDGLFAADGLSSLSQRPVARAYVLSLQLLQHAVTTGLLRPSPPESGLDVYREVRRRWRWLTAIVDAAAWLAEFGGALAVRRQEAATGLSPQAKTVAWALCGLSGDHAGVAATAPAESRQVPPWAAEGPVRVVAALTVAANVLVSGTSGPPGRSSSRVAQLEDAIECLFSSRPWHHLP